VIIWSSNCVCSYPIEYLTIYWTDLYEIFTLVDMLVAIINRVHILCSFKGLATATNSFLGQVMSIDWYNRHTLHSRSQTNWNIAIKMHGLTAAMIPQHGAKIWWAWAQWVRRLQSSSVISGRDQHLGKFTTTFARDSTVKHCVDQYIIFFRYYSLGCDFAIPGGLHARLCIAFLVFWGSTRLVLSHLMRP